MISADRGWLYPAAVAVEMPIGLNHLDTDFCWCDPKRRQSRLLRYCRGDIIEIYKRSGGTVTYRLDGGMRWDWQRD